MEKVNVTSHNQSGGITAQNVNVKGKLDQTSSAIINNDHKRSNLLLAMEWIGLIVALFADVFSLLAILKIIQ